MQYGHFGRAWWGVSTFALMSAMSVGVPALAAGPNEITISATRRVGATVQGTPIAVTAIGPAAIQNAGIRDVRDLTQLAPSFQFFTGQSNSAGTTAYVRGIGTGGDNPGFESAVGFFVDGVYRNRSGVALGDLPAVESVEVLRGPQGTLFGKNTTAGVISVTTASPSFSHSSYGYGTYGTYDTWELNGGVTGPVTKDKFAVRLDADMRGRNGTITDIRQGRKINDRDRWYIRGQALWEMSSVASLRIIGDMARTDEQCCAAITLVKGSTAAGIAVVGAFNPGMIGVLGPSVGTNPNVRDRKTTVTPGRDYAEKVKEWGLSGELNWDWGGPKFTSITSYRKWDANRNQDIDFSDMDRAYRAGYEVGFKTFTEEMRLQGEHGALNWLIGGYYANEKLPLTDRIRVGTNAAQYVDALALGADVSLAGFGFTPNQEIYDTLPVAGHTPSFFLQALSILGAAPAGACGAVSCASSPVIQANILAGAVPINAGLSVSDPVNGQGQQADKWNQNTTSWALFTHDELKLSPRWTLTLGYRYNHEQKQMSANLNAVSPGCGVLQVPLNATAAGSVALFAPNPLLPAGTQAGLRSLRSAVLSFMTLACNPAVNTISNGTFGDKLSENESNGTAVMSYKPNDNFMLYASYARGYKAGGYNLDRSGFNVTPFSTVVPSTNDLQFKSEFTDSYEMGWKWSWGGDTSALNGAVFEEKVQDFQENAFSGFNFITFNVPKVTSRGAELEYAYEPNKHWSFQAGVTYLDAFFNSAITIVGETLPAGTPLTQSPTWTLTSALTYSHPFNRSLQWLASIDGRYNTSYRVQVLNRNPATDNGAFSILNARLGIGAQDGSWMFESWIRNLTDETYNVGAFGVPEQTGTYDVYPNEPLTWGGTFRLHY